MRVLDVVLEVDVKQNALLKEEKELLGWLEAKGEDVLARPPLLRPERGRRQRPGQKMMMEATTPPKRRRIPLSQSPHHHCPPNLTPT